MKKQCTRQMQQLRSKQVRSNTRVPHLRAAEARRLLSHDDIGGDAALAVSRARQRDQRRLLRHKVLSRAGGKQIGVWVGSEEQGSKVHLLSIIDTS